MSSPTKADSGQAAVKVFVRIRPFVERELTSGDSSPTVRVSHDGCQIAVLDPSRGWQPKEYFPFDYCFWSVGADHLVVPLERSPELSDAFIRQSSSFTGQFASQESVFDVVGRDALRNTFEGFNSCIFAYGQTGSGKTFTMMGDTTCATKRGLIPRIGLSLFEHVQDLRTVDTSLSVRVECAYFEIYNERVFDLLQPGLEDLRVRQDPVTGPYVEGLSWRHVSAAQTILDIISMGNTERHTAATKMNDRSSRSHAILCLSISQLRIQDDGSSTRVSSKLNLVDLAGSERTSLSGVEGTAFREATKINLSLTTLGRVIDALADQSSAKMGARPPYRESLLTWLLMDSLGGNSKTAMIATLSPAATHYDEMLNTLRYACRAREIINTVVINEDPSIRKIKELQAINEKLRKQLSTRVGSDQVTELEAKLQAALRQKEDLRAELNSVKSTLSMKEASLMSLRQEVTKMRADTPPSASANASPTPPVNFSQICISYRRYDGLSTEWQPNVVPSLS